MLGNFTYCNPTRLHFGDDSLKALKEELANYGPKVLLVYGGGSVKKNGIYDQVINVLAEAGKTVVEVSGVMSNPTLEKLYEGAKIARDSHADLILALGGGSVCDYSKAVSVSAYCKEDPWDKYYVNQGNPDADLEIIPVGCILTMVGTGSEMNGGSVITDHAHKLKIGKVFGTNVMPKFTILNPTFTFSVPQYQMVAGFFDIMSHIMEQYFSGEDDNTSDYVAESLMRSLIHSSLIAVKNPHDYEARSNIMWTATWALNTFIGMGKAQDWMVHMIGHSIGAYTNATHGMTLAAVSLPYYRFILSQGLPKFRRFAVNVWNVCEDGKSDETIALEGLAEMKKWMEALGLVLKISELGVTNDMLEGIADGTFIITTGYRTLTKPEIIHILKESM